MVYCSGGIRQDSVAVESGPASIKTETRLSREPYGLIKDPASTEPEQIDEKPAQRCDPNGNAEGNQSAEEGRDEARPLMRGHEASVSMSRASRSSSRV